MKYIIEKWIPTPYGAGAVYGGLYRWRWMAAVAKWLLELCPDLREHKIVRIKRVPDDFTFEPPTTEGGHG